jgi:uncharacterized membrane protein YdfJ with MMPL/SSD domain
VHCRPHRGVQRLTVASSLFCLHLLPQRFFQNMGLAGSISVGAAMLTAVVLLPALLAMLGHRVNRLSLPSLARRACAQEEGGHWYRYSYFVMRRAWAVLLDHPGPAAGDGVAGAAHGDRPG